MVTVELTACCLICLFLARGSSGQVDLVLLALRVRKVASWQQPAACYVATVAIQPLHDAFVRVKRQAQLALIAAKVVAHKIGVLSHCARKWDPKLKKERDTLKALARLWTGTDSAKRTSENIRKPRFDEGTGANRPLATLVSVQL